MARVVRVAWLSGSQQDFTLPPRATIRDLRQVICLETKAPFLTLCNETGDVLELDSPVALQIASTPSPELVQVIIQRPQLCLTMYGAVLWCPHNPILAPLGDENCGGTLDLLPTDIPPIRSVFGVYKYFLAVTERDQFIVWGNAPSVLLGPELCGPLEDIVADQRNIALRWPGGNVDVWHTGKNGWCHESEPVCKWTNVTLLKASEYAIVAILESGEIAVHGILRSGGFVPHEIQVHVATAIAEDIIVAVESICVKCADGSAATWGRMTDIGIITRSPTKKITDIKASCSAFAALWDDGTVSAWGDPRDGGDCTSVAHQLQQVLLLGANNAAFAAITISKVVTWGYSNCAMCDAPHLEAPARSIYSTEGAFALILESGALKVWGDRRHGGCTWHDQVVDVISITATASAFAALHVNRTITAWGNTRYGGDSFEVRSELVEILWVCANRDTFFAYRIDDTLVAWGATVGKYSYAVNQDVPTTPAPADDLAAI